MTTLPRVPEGLTLPEIWCPLAVEVHPEAGIIEQVLLAWATGTGLVSGEAAAERFSLARYGVFTAYTVPRAADLPLAAQWNAFDWLVDDQLDEEGVGFEFCRELLSRMPVQTDTAPAGSPSPLLAALDDLWRRTAPGRSTEWRRRFTGHYRDWLAFSVLARRHRDDADIETYFRRRRIHSGVEMSFDLTEACDDRELPPDLVASQQYRELRAVANNAISWANDIYSIRKELGNGDGGFLPALLVTGHGYDWPTALARSAEMIAAATRDFLTACDDLREAAPLYGTECIEESITILSRWIAGSLRWHAESDRYRRSSVAWKEGGDPGTGTPTVEAGVTKESHVRSHDRSDRHAHQGRAGGSSGTPAGEPARADGGPARELQEERGRVPRQRRRPALTRLRRERPGAA